MKINKGITLIALVITIIVLLILAGVSIAMLTGENGILTKATYSQQSDRVGKLKDKVSLWKYEQIMDGKLNENKSESLESFVGNLVTEGILTEQEADEVKKNGEITIGNETIQFFEKEKALINAATIKSDAPNYYGKEIKGYTCSGQGVDKWRIFYADETNIYIIADSFIENSYPPKTANGISVNPTMGKYAVYFFDICLDEPTYSKGSTWISENSKGAKWLSKFLAQNPTNREYNLKANAYLMDTNIWNIYSGEKADYAMGGPTLELYCASYKDTHPDKYIENEVDSVGYKVKWNSSYSYSDSISGLSTSQSDFNNIYIKSIGVEAIGMWIAAPSSYDPQDSASLMIADYSGSIGNKKINGGAAFALRPIVCLSSNVQIEDLEDGTYLIK